MYCTVFFPSLRIELKCIWDVKIQKWYSVSVPTRPCALGYEEIKTKNMSILSLSFSVTHPVLMARICSRRVEATLRAVLSWETPGLCSSCRG